MSGNIAAQQKFAERFGDCLRLYEAEGGNIHALAERIGEEARDLRRWADGTKLPTHVFVLLLGALPRHLADKLIATTGLRLVSQNAVEDVNSLLIAAKASEFSGKVASRWADGRYCHVDAAETKQDAARLAADLQTLSGE